MIDLRNKHVLVVGLARSGRAAVRALRRRGALVSVSDSRPPAAFQQEIPELVADKVGLELGMHRQETFLKQDLIVVSPGVPWELPALQVARHRGIPVAPEIEIAGWYLEGYRVGITGSNGKTTTATLAGQMLAASAFPTFVGGNIGVPLISAVDQVSSDSMIVAELSSFQLEAIQDFRVNVAVLLNIAPNHLDRHPSFEAYFRAKAQIFRNQTAEDYAVLNADDSMVMSLAPAIASRKVFFSLKQNLPEGVLASDGRILYRTGNLERVLMETSDVKLRGAFNLQNVLAASAVACVCGADFDALRRVVREFNGVEHRLEYVRDIRGVQFYNDSKATSVDATAKALWAFEGGVHLILGGKDKGAPYAPLRPLIQARVPEVLLIGAAAERIAEELSGAAPLVPAGDLETAVRKAFEHASPGDAVLLAPACASYDQFQDFEHRGRAFKEIVARLAEEEAGPRGRDSGKGIPDCRFQIQDRKPVWSQPATERTLGLEPEISAQPPSERPSALQSGVASRPSSERASALEPEISAQLLSQRASAFESEICNLKSQISGPESPTPSPDLRIPSSEPRLLGRPDPIHFFETAAEEFAPLSECWVRSAESEVEMAPEVLRPIEDAVDEPMLCEVRSPVCSSNRNGERTPVDAGSQGGLVRRATSDE